MADEVGSQARFVGWLAFGLLIFALLVAAFVAYSGMHVPPV